MFHPLQRVAFWRRTRKVYMAVRAQTGERTAAAMEIRTLLDGVKGELWERAKKWPKENMTWDIMADRLAVNDLTGHSKELMTQGKIRSSLIHRLSDIGKDREGGSATNLDYIWTEVLDHLYAILGLIGIN